MKESFKKEIAELGNLYNPIDNPEIADSEDRKKSLVGIATISAGIAGIAASVIPKNAKADESYGVGVELGPDVNWIQGEGCPTAWMVSNGCAQLMPGVMPNRFKLTFCGAYYDNECKSASAVLAKEFEVADTVDGGIIIKGLGKTLPLASTYVASQYVGDCVEVDRGDGRTSKIIFNGDNQIFKDGELKWEYGEGDCWSAIYSVHATADDPLKVKISSSFCSDALEDCWFNPWRVNINESDYCFAIQQSINDAWEKEGKDPYEAGLLKHIEDGKGNAPETDKLLLVGSDDKSGVSFVKHDPQTDQYTHLKHNADGTYTPENPQKGGAEFPSPPPWKQNSMYAMALLKVQTPSGKQVHLIATQGEKINWAGGYFDIRLYGVEELTDEKGETYFKDINITLEETDQYPDDDGDSKANHEDNCRWRANSDQINSTADENGDACKADCKEGGWVGVDAPLQTNSSGLRVCQSELGFDFAFSFEDGSTIHSNMDVEVLNGKIMLKPGQKVRFIHSWDPRTEKLSASFISLPAGNSVKLKVNSAKNLDGTDGQTVFTHDGAPEYFNDAMDWQDFGIIGAGEIEGASDIEIEVGNENPVTVVEEAAEAQAEPAVSVEKGAEISVAEPAQNSAEETVIVAEQPTVVEELTQAELVVEKAADTAELVAAVEPSQAEPDQNAAEEGFSIAEMPPIVVEEASIAEQPVVVEPAPDIFVGQPEADAQPNQIETFSDTTQGEFDDGQTTPQETELNPQDTGADLKPDSLPFADAPISPDTPAKPDTPNIPQKKDTVSGVDTFNSADIGTDSSKPVGQEKNGGGNGGGCSMAFILDRKHENLPYQNFNNIDGAGLLITASILARLYSWTRKRIARV